MRSDDIAPLIGQQPTAQGVGFRQGVVISWDPLTARNTVDVGGTVLTDVPILNSMETLILAPGDVVGLLTTGQGAQSWWIIGRATIPGTPQAASVLSAVGLVGDVFVGLMSEVSATDYIDLPNSPTVSTLIGASKRCLVIFGASFLWASDSEGFVGHSAYVTLGSTAPDGAINTINNGDSSALACEMSDGSTGLSTYPGVSFISASKVLYNDATTGLNQAGTWSFHLRGRVSGGSTFMSHGHLAVLPF